MVPAQEAQRQAISILEEMVKSVGVGYGSARAGIF